MCGDFETPPLSVFEWSPDSKAALRGDAHHEEGLEVHQDVLQRVPHIREEHNEELVLQVEVEPLGVDNDDAEEDNVDDGKRDQGMVKVGLHLWSGDGDCDSRCDNDYDIIDEGQSFT